MIPSIHVQLTQAEFYMRHVRTRMPFRYGSASLQFAPILHLLVTVLSEDGRKATGVAADVLPPKWFDKDPQKDFRQNVADLVWSACSARDVNLALSGQKFWTPFDLWQASLDDIQARGTEHGLNWLTINHGSSLFERAIIDAVGRLEDLNFQQLLIQNRLGLRPDAVHSELAQFDWQAVFSVTPQRYLWSRHTVGLADPLRNSDVPASARLDDGLPQSLEEYIDQQGLLYFKVKVSGDADADRARLKDIAHLLNEKIATDYFISLDGNEQYDSVEPFLELITLLQTDAQTSRFMDSVLYIEQPFARNIALNGTLRSSLPKLTAFRPVVIDESDEHLNTLKQSLSFGYGGISAKNCKGVYKSILNRLLIERCNVSLPSGAQPYFMTGEDLMNTAVVPLHQDTSVLRVLGIRHAERNGHHYVRGLDHLSESEREACLSLHTGMYERMGSSGRLRIQQGCLDTQSLNVPGLGVGIPTDTASMIPLERWAFDDLLNN